MNSDSQRNTSRDQLQSAIHKENKKFEEFYSWIEKHMPPRFFEQVDSDSLILIVHSLMGLDLSDYFSRIHLKDRGFVLCLDSPDADLNVLKGYQMQGIRNYRAFLSNEPPPFKGAKARLRITCILFTDAKESEQELFTQEQKKEIGREVQERNAEATQADVEHLLAQLSPSFVRGITQERLVLALDMFFRAKTRDMCQYEVRYNEEWREKKDTPSMQIVFAWRNVPKFHFLYQMAKIVHRHGLRMKYIAATHIDPYSQQNIVIMSLGLHGSKDGAAWEEADVADFLKELVTLKYFRGLEHIETTFVETGLLSGNKGNLVKTCVYFVHQILVHLDPYLYSLPNIEEGLCRHPELVVSLIQAFDWKFNPDNLQIEKYKQARESFLHLVDHLDTGNEINDARRKNILKQTLNFIDHTLKTNFYRNNKTAFSFRLDSSYLDCVPFERKDKFPELPYAIFFIKGLHFIGFHIRFRDLSRGGLRTVLPNRMEQVFVERNNVFSECYNLAYTQNKKNKDIPEGGAKGVIFAEPLEWIAVEMKICQKEMEEEGISSEEVKKWLAKYQKEQKLEYLYQTQRAYIESLITLINCNSDGTLRAKHVVDYWKKPEYIYLGPDENMHNTMIEWIAEYSKKCDYKPAGAFISSKPGAGINHKEFGVTSYGVNVYMEEVLRFLGIDPAHEAFTVKMTGGPDGDVAGNQIFNLYRFYPKTAKLLATTDISGTIYDPKGLDLSLMTDLFKESKPLRFYPPEKLNEGGFLLDTFSKREQTAYAQQTLFYRKVNGKIVEEWLSGNEMNNLLRHNVHKIKADVFIPGGGRPRTLNETNIKDFFDEAGKPTARAIVEGANLYLTPWARRSLEKAGVIIIKDSSANKGGVICSSFEVLASLVLTEEEFLKNKPTIVAEILKIIEKRAREEAGLLLRTHKENNAYLTDISEWVSERINLYKDQLMAHFQDIALSNDPKDPLIRCLIHYCPHWLKTHHLKRLLSEVPDVHKKAIIACHIASRLVYFRGLDWSPSLIDVLPLVVQDPLIIGTE
ncbi:MAG TPA: NAD-glutamate dehydrogenase domain-containing protein [Rhabdochlamydiaceae bacterium]|jgi:glutamate dehydrogenase